MYNNVVEAVEEGFVLSGFSTLRFNFRGVGDSEGAYDEGNGEVNDAIAACRFMRDLLGAGSRLVLAGYSFGAWVASRAAARIQGLKDLFLVAYPFSRYEPSELRAFEGRLYFVGGYYARGVQRLAVLYSDTAGRTWHQGARSDDWSGCPVYVNTSRDLVSDGSVIGSFTATSGGQTGVYFFRSAAV